MEYQEVEMECPEIQCCVCDEDYNDQQVPRNLSCGHSVCSRCINFLIPFGKKCPECRTKFSENQASELPINYPLLRMSRLFTHEKLDFIEFPELKFPIGSSLSERQQDAGTCSSHECALFFMCVSCSVWVCRDCLVVDHPDPPRGKCFILPVAEAIDKIKKSHTNAIEHYAAELNVPRDKFKRDIGVLVITLKSLKNLSQEGDFGYNKELEEIEKQIKAIEVLLSTLDSIENSLKGAKEKISSSNSPIEISISMEESAACQSYFEKFVENEMDRAMPDILNMMFREKKDLKELLEGGKPVYVARKDGDRCLWAKIAIDENRLHLFSLRNDTAPEDGITLPFEVVRELLPKESPVVFLEVGWGGEIKGRVYVRMFGDSPRGQQAVFLCSGEKGSSYRNTCFYELKKTDGIPYVLQGGDYESNNGRGGRGIVNGISNCNDYPHEIKAGLFFGWDSSEEFHLGSFNIYLIDAPGANEPYAFGQVEQGLDILMEACTLTPVNNAFVIDCGLVIPL